MSAFLKRSIMTAVAVTALYGACNQANAISVTVTGSWPGYCDMSCYDVGNRSWDDWGDYDDYYYDNSGENSGGGGDETPDPVAACKSNDPATIDAYSDALAVASSNTIRAQSDFTRREYGQLIYRDAQGSIRLTALVTGTPTSTTFNFAQLGVSPANVVGVVHNHPRDVYNTSAQEMQINLNPSNGDWATADSLVQAGANADLLQLYVVGTDGRLREFDYNNKSSYLPRRVIGVGLAVTPGAQVPTNLVAEPCP